MHTACSQLTAAVTALPEVHRGLEHAYDVSIGAALALDDATADQRAGAAESFNSAAHAEATRFLDFQHHCRTVRAAIRQLDELMDRVEAVYEPGDGIVREELSAGLAGRSPSAHPKKQGASPADESPPAA